MSDDDVLAALKVLKRHGKLEDSMFFATVRSCQKSIRHFFLPDIKNVAENGIEGELGYELAIFCGGKAAWAYFNTQEEQKAFVNKWRLAKLAAMLY